MIISDRCIINLPDRNLQKKAIIKIRNVLRRNGHYIMVENFVEGHREMNRLRRKLNLEEIPIRWHNTYLDEKFVNDNLLPFFSLKKRENISSIYYLITRVVYSKICAEEGREPDYDNIIYKIAVNLDENLGNYGPTTLLLFKKK